MRGVSRYELIGVGNPNRLGAQLIRLIVDVQELERKNRGFATKLKDFAVKNKPVPAAKFGGDWRTNFGPITFAQTRRHVVTGTYFWSGGGTVRGKVQGQVLSGTYSDGNGTGSFTVTMNPDGRAWAGAYKADSGGTGGWAGVR